METARGLAELLKTGWRPKRTIILALWDGEEWGLLGSTEWAEKHAAELKQKAAVYINTDGTGKGWLNAGGSHGLQQFLSEVAQGRDGPAHRQAGLRGSAPPRDVLARPRPTARPRSRPVAPARAARFRLRLHAFPAAPDALGAQPRLRRREPRRRLSLGLRHRSSGTQKFSDGDFTYGRTLSQLTGTLVLRLADAARAAVPVHRHRRHPAALRRRAREAGGDRRRTRRST